MNGIFKIDYRTEYLSEAALVAEIKDKLTVYKCECFSDPNRTLIKFSDIEYKLSNELFHKHFNIGVNK